MDANHDTRFLLELDTASVRHLAWLCSAPPLLESSRTFRPRDSLPGDYRQRLRHWDTELTGMPEALQPPYPRRLGFYAERLYGVLLNDLLGWPVLLHNQPVRDHGRTLGELDFVVRNLREGRIEHHEIAIKYYLGIRAPDGDCRWYGPDARDRLDLKVARLLNHQSLMTHRPETLDLLAQHGIAGPLTSRLFMPGYLFYPGGAQAGVTPPPYVPGDHLRGLWLYHREAEATALPGLCPPDQAPLDGALATGPGAEASAVRAARALCCERQRPQLFARLAWRPELGAWTEVERLFVVPDGWPELPGR